MMPITDTAVRDALRQVIDPELGINIVDLGLVYGIESPACPLGDYLKDLVDSMVKWRVRDVEEIEIALVWDPRWNPDMMSADAQQQLDGGRL
jgi:metal-sulfur cluster biosynthetic enzyme